MFKDFKFSLEHIYEGKRYLTTSADNEYYSIKSEEGKNGLIVTLIPKTKLTLLNAYLTTTYNYAENDKVYVNGYQSWTTSREYGQDDIQKGLRGLGKYPPVRLLMSMYGDYDFQKYSLKAGEFHSYSYTYVKREGRLTLLGSMTERTGFTVFHHAMQGNCLTVQKDVEGVTLDAEYEIFNLYWTEGGYEQVFDAYFAALGVKKPRHKHMCGYTSWYNYYGGITEASLARDIDGLARMGDKADIFQIDDGYQIAVGDWLTVKADKYPNGMKYLADKIHEKGYLAGIWLAPFNAQLHSKVATEHPDWLIKNKNGKSQWGSIAWNGAYTLDFYIPEAADYIKNFFHVILNDWGFDMVKLDFLYSVCRRPRRNKSRGQLMTEAMEFLRECVGDKLMLGCGVPLFPAFGVVDFCRISSDVGASFTDPFYLMHSNQEAFSTKGAMNNSIFRRHLDGRAFVNDPDVFYLRESELLGKDPYALKKGKLVFTEPQKELLAEINRMCGNVLFVSDNVGAFDERQMKLLEKTFTPTDRTVLDAEYTRDDVISITYKEGGKTYRLMFNTEIGTTTRKEI